MSALSTPSDVARPLVIYHAQCPDGFGAALAAWLVLRERADYLPAWHGDPPPDVSGRSVYLLDFCYPRPQMEALGRQAACLVLLDHHKTAQEALRGFACRCGEIRFEPEKSGAVLAWEHFHPGQPVPALLRHVQDRDLWRWELPASRAFLAALDEQPRSFEAWEALLALSGEALERFTAAGEVLVRHQARLCRDIAEHARPVELGGLAGLMVNCNVEFASDVGNLLAQRCGTFGLTWFVPREGMVHVSLRSTPACPVDPLAVAFGGGGHPHACGFRLSLEHLPELLSGTLQLPLSQESAPA